MIGSTISHYKILAKLGEGGMGAVYKARDTTLNRDVALKFLPHSLTSDPTEKERFYREARAASALNHPNITTIYEINEHEGQLFIAMEFIGGRSIKGLLRERNLSQQEVLDIAIQICEGLHVAQKKGIVHRDIKSDNIMVTDEGLVKIMDFGLAKLKGTPELTRTGTTVGTMHYMSPEQAQGMQVDQRSDIFSFGVVLYEMITGQLPFKGEHEAAVLYSLLNEDPEPLSRYKTNVPDELQRTVTKAMEKNRDLRFQHVDDVRADLLKIKSERDTSSAPSFTKRHQPSIAVLPFTNVSADKEQEYFCDGMAEEIINALSQVEDLRVVARTSAFSFRGKEIDIREIGKRLNVETLLEGSVRKSGNRLRITAQLVAVADGYHLWSERYDREMVDIFAIQEEISLAIVDKLRVKLLQGEKEKLFRHRTNNPDAYNLYMQGRFFFNQRKEAGIQKSIECYLQAIEIDPGFALAYTSLAESYVFLGDWRVLPLDTAYNEARKAAMTALQIDDTISEVHVSLAEIKLFCDWDWAAAEREFKRALAINPACAEAHHMYAHYLELNGRFDDALTEVQHAIELEPVSPSLYSCNVQVLFYARRYGDSIKKCYAAMEMAPSFFGLYGWLGIAYVQNDMIDCGVEALQNGLQHLPLDPRLKAFLGYTYAVAGREAEAKECLQQLVSISDTKYVDPYFITWLYAALGDPPAACGSLNKAYDEHSEWLPWLGVDPLLDTLRSDSRFKEVLKKMRLEK
jgi:serine/threonine protein kinase/lipoprotein NlpI